MMIQLIFYEMRVSRYNIFLFSFGDRISSDRKRAPFIIYENWLMKFQFVCLLLVVYHYVNKLPIADTNESYILSQVISSY